MLLLVTSIFLSFTILMAVIVDTILWIIIIVTGAANMVIGGLHEAHIDYRVIGLVSTLVAEDDKAELLVGVASGNLMHKDEELREGDPQREISRNPFTPVNPSTNTQNAPSIMASLINRRNEKRRARLLCILSSQASFGAAVGGPVLFYLGAFVYTVLDLLTIPSNQDTAFSLAFGVEWMII